MNKKDRQNMTFDQINTLRAKKQVELTDKRQEIENKEKERLGKTGTVRADINAEIEVLKAEEMEITEEYNSLMED